MKPDLVSVVTAHMVYFCAFACSEIFQTTARKSGVGRGQFDAGVNGLTSDVLKQHVFSNKFFVFPGVSKNWNSTVFQILLKALDSTYCITLICACN